MRTAGGRPAALSLHGGEMLNFFSYFFSICVVVTCKDDGVEAGFAPQLHEMNHIAKAQWGVAGENHAGLAELAAEVSVDAGIVLQLVGLDQLEHKTYYKWNLRPIPPQTCLNVALATDDKFPLTQDGRQKS